MSRILNVGDEEAFINFAEKVVFDLQQLWRGKEGLELSPVIDMSAKLEDLVYNDALSEYSLSSTANVWAKKECIMYYQETCDKMLKNLEYKHQNWRKLFEDNEKNPRAVLSAILHDDGVRKQQKMVSAMPKQLKIPKQKKERVAPAPRTSTGSGRGGRGGRGGQSKTKSSQSVKPGSSNQGSSSNNNNNSNSIQPIENMMMPYDDPFPMDMYNNTANGGVPGNTIHLERLISESSIDGLGFDFLDDDALGGGVSASAAAGNIIANEQAWYNI